MNRLSNDDTLLDGYEGRSTIVCTVNWLARLLAYVLARWKMDGDGERTRKRTCRVERRHKRRLFQQND